MPYVFDPKTARPRLFTSYIEVLKIVEEVKTDVINLADSSVVSVVMQAPQVESFIYQADTVIRSMLRRYYSDANMRVTPWATTVYNGKSNVGTGKLISVDANNTTAYTATWIIEWSGTANVAVTGTGATIYVLESDATFNIGYDGNSVVLCTVAAADTTGNTTIDNLVTDVQTAVNTALTANKVTVTHSGDILVFTSVSSGLTSDVRITSPNAFATNDLGISATYTYTLTSSLEGSQGTGGTTGADMTSTNTDVIIPTAGWSGSPLDGDLFYFSIVDSDPLINTISTKLSAAYILNTIFQQAPVTELTYDRKLERQAMDLLGKLARPYDKDGIVLSGTIPTVSGDSLWVDYDITDAGEDNSSYLTTDNT
jgi:hypothetical protein